jgi:hypothetical protein
MITTLATVILTPASLAVVPPQAPASQPEPYSHIAQARKSDFDCNQGTTVQGTSSYVGQTFTIDDANNWG